MHPNSVVLAGAVDLLPIEVVVFLSLNATFDCVCVYVIVIGLEGGK